MLWHSVIWQYVSAADQAAILSHMAAAGATAGPSSPVAHVSFEPRLPAPGAPHRFLVAIRVWPGSSAVRRSGEETLIGRAPPHGVPVTWI